MANRVCTNFKDTLGNDLGCRFITKEDAVDFIVALNDYSEAQITPWGAGKNDTYQLGLGADTTNRSSPVVVGSGAESRKWSGLSGGFGFAASLNVDGNIWSWGLNSDGQLGDSSTITKSNPVLVSGVGGFKGIMAGREFVVGVKHTGTLWAWGKNHCGQLGDSTTITKSCPVQIGALTCWKNVWAYSNGYTAAGITEDGKLFRWGINTSGQIGDGTTINKSSPIQIGALTTWKCVTSRGGATYGWKTDGTIWHWGNVILFASCTNTCYSTPVQFATAADNWKQFVVSGSNHVIGLKKNGTIWGWGGNGSGQLGIGTTVVTCSAVQIGSGCDWRFVESEYGVSYGIKTDGSLWSWGSNNQGQLGDGTTINKSTPIQVGAWKDWYCVSTKIQTTAFRLYGECSCL